MKALGCHELQGFGVWSSERDRQGTDRLRLFSGYGGGTERGFWAFGKSSDIFMN